MRILFVHQNFPGQFRYLASALAGRGHRVVALAHTPRFTPPGVTVIPYPIPRPSGRPLHPWAVDFDTKTIRAEACARQMLVLRDKGFTPDVVVGHSGWGETWMVKDVWPQTRVLAFQEFFYGADVNFDPEFPEDEQLSRLRIRVKNASLLCGLETMDWGLSPTAWQHSQFPELFRNRISIIFDGIDTDLVAPGPTEPLSLGTPAVTLSPGEELLTFVNRNLEPYRGYHTFMRALPKFLRLRPKARVVIVGGDGCSYGAPPPEGTWKERFLGEVAPALDRERVHFVGMLPYGSLIKLFRLTRCHVYLTYPFILSWSMLDAMSAGAVVLASRTGPVLEAITDGHNGVLTDFFDADALAERAAAIVAEPEKYSELARQARATVLERYGLQQTCLPRQVSLVESLAGGPPEARPELGPPLPHRASCLEPSSLS